MRSDNTPILHLFHTLFVGGWYTTFLLSAILLNAIMNSDSLYASQCFWCLPLGLWQIQSFPFPFIIGWLGVGEVIHLSPLRVD